MYISSDLVSIPFDISAQMNLKLNDNESGRGAFHGFTEYLNSGILNSQDFIRRGFRAKS